MLGRRALAAAALGVFTCTATAAPVDYSSRLHWVGGLDLPGEVRDVALATPGDGAAHAVVHVLVHDADEGGRLVAVDVTDPGNPAPMADLPLPGVVTALAVDGSRAFVTAFGVGLLVSEIEGAPTLLETFALPGDAAGLCVSDGRVAVADGIGGTTLIDLRDAEAPVVGLPATTDDSARGVAIVSDRVLVAEGALGLGVLAIEGDVSLARVGSFALDGFAFDVALAGVEAVGGGRGGAQAQVAVALGDGGVAFVDVDLETPSLSSVIGQVATRDRAMRVVVAGDLVLVADESGGLFLIDASSPSAPEVLGRIGTPAAVASASVTPGGLLAVADRSTGLQLFDATAPRAVPYLAALELGGTARGLARSVVAPGDTVVWVAAGSRGLLALNVTGDVPVIRAELPAVDAVLDLGDMSGGRVAIAEASHLFVVAGSGAGGTLDLETVGRLELPQPPRGVAASGSLIFVAAGDDGLMIVDASNPEALVLAGVLDTFGIHADVEARGTRVYDLDRTFGLHVVDVSDPAAPVVLGVLDLVEPFVALDVDDEPEGACAYVVTHSLFGWPVGTLHVVDVTDPALPVIEGSVTVPGRPVGLDVVGGVAYVADGWAGVTVVDVRDPAAPVVIGGRTTRLDARAVHVVGTRVLVADGLAGLTVLPVHLDPATPIGEPVEPPPPALVSRARVRVTPNPMSSRTRIFVADPLGARGTAGDPSVSIYDVAGRLVRRLGVSGGEVTWDGRDEEARAVAGGVYVVLAARDGEAGRARVTVLR